MDPKNNQSTKSSQALLPQELMVEILNILNQNQDQDQDPPKRNIRLSNKSFREAFDLSKKEQEEKTQFAFKDLHQNPTLQQPENFISQIKHNFLNKTIQTKFNQHDGRYSILYAAIFRFPHIKIEFIEKLLKHGCNPSQYVTLQDKGGDKINVSPLFLVVNNEREGLLTTLIKHGYNLNQPMIVNLEDKDSTLFENHRTAAIEALNKVLDKTTDQSQRNLLQGQIDLLQTDAAPTVEKAQTIQLLQTTHANQP